MRRVESENGKRYAYTSLNQQLIVNPQLRHHIWNIDGFPRVPATERPCAPAERSDDMDLNELLYHHQMALMTVGRAQRAGRSAVSFDLPCYYARRIKEYRKRRGLTVESGKATCRERGC